MSGGPILTSILREDGNFYTVIVGMHCKGNIDGISNSIGLMFTTPMIEVIQRYIHELEGNL